MTRLSCHRFRASEVRVWLSLIAYNVGISGRCVPPDAKPSPAGAAGNTVDQNWPKPCRARPFGLYGDLIGD